MIRRGAILLVAVAALAVPAIASACSCAGGGSPAREFADAGAVFAGTVTSIGDGPRRSSGILARVRGWLGLATPHRRSVILSVSESWKGVTASSVVVKTGFGGGDCGVGFAVGARWLVYANEYEGALYTGICSRTAELVHAKEDLEFLRTQPLLALSESPSRAWALPVATGGVLLAAAIGWIALRRARAPAR